jgi:hypothetical protein
MKAQRIYPKPTAEELLRAKKSAHITFIKLWKKLSKEK